jgi:ferredoxin-type protein NapH
MSATQGKPVGAGAVAEKGWWRAHKWLILRRFSQLFILALFLVGMAIVLVVYLLVGGRVYCSWVCPLNVVTDTAGWLRDWLGIKGCAQLGRNTRYWILGMSFVGSAVTGVLVVFLFDLFVMHRGWCGRLCPVGAFYSLLGHWSLLHVAAVRRSACNDCMACFEVCPEPQVIRSALKGEEQGVGPVILAPNCTNCGRCIDVCAKDVFRFGGRQ